MTRKQLTTARKAAMETADYKAGFTAERAGVRWYENPRPSGSVASYQWDCGHTAARHETRERLNAIRAAIENESVSYGEIAELQAIAAANPLALEGCTTLQEWAGIPESEASA